MPRPALALALTLLAAPAARRQTAPQRMAPPARDLRGATDDAALPRYTGSVLLASGAATFEEVEIPRGPLVDQGGRDAQGNRNYVDPNAIRVEGRRARLLYVLPPGRTPLEAVRGYQQAARAAGGQVAYECAEQACGGETRRGATWGGGWAGMVNRVYPKPDIPTATDSPVYCALAVGHTDNQGGLAANVELSRRRAQAVVDALVRTQGVAAARLTPQGVGMAAPVAGNQGDAGRAKNRRVELVQQ